MSTLLSVPPATVPMLVNELIWTAVVPLVIAAGVIGTAAWLSIRPRPAWALGVGLGYIVGSVAVTSRSAGLSPAVAKLVRPHEAHDWLPLAVLLAMGVTLLAAAAPRAWQRWIVGLAGLVRVSPCRCDCWPAMSPPNGRPARSWPTSPCSLPPWHSSGCCWPPLVTTSSPASARSCW